MGRLAATLILTLGFAATAAAGDGLAPRSGDLRQPDNPNVGIDDKVGQQVPLDLTFADETGKDVTIGECIGGKPTILVLAYYRCPMNCTDVLNGLVDAMRAMPSDVSVGGAFNVVTVSFDPKEAYNIAHEKKRVYLADYGRPGAEEGWHFLTGKVGTTVKQKDEAIHQLTDAVGFKFFYDKVFKEYDHPTGVIVLTPAGKIARYFYGQKYDGEYRVPGGTTTLRLTLVEASDGKVGSLLDRLILRCYRFDHLERKYSLNIMLAVRVGGAVTILLLVAGVSYFVVRDRRRPTVGTGGVPGSDSQTTCGPAGQPAEGVT